MPWLELSLQLRAEQQPEVESALENIGALSITLLDAEDHPIFEPGVGETPLWPTLVLTALFDVGCDRQGLLHALTDLVPELGSATDRLSRSRRRGLDSGLDGYLPADAVWPAVVDLSVEHRAECRRCRARRYDCGAAGSGPGVWHRHPPRLLRCAWNGSKARRWPGGA